jgi:hypothetical protein
MVCTEGHEETWASSEDTGQKKTTAAEVNVDLTSSILLSGLRFNRVKVTAANAA